MRKIFFYIISMLLICSMVSCSSVDTNYDEKYELGLSYVFNKDYDNAILTFNEAIKIDNTRVPAYITLAETYVIRAQYSKAVALLEDAKIILVDNTFVSEKLDEIIHNENVRNGNYTITEYKGNNIVSEFFYNKDKGILNTHIHEYDKNNNRIKSAFYDAEGELKMYDCNEYDNNGNNIKWVRYFENGAIYHSAINEYDNSNKLIKRELYTLEAGSTWFETYEYDVNNNLIKTQRYDTDWNPGRYIIYKYDGDGNLINKTTYRSDGTRVPFQ